MFRFVNVSNKHYNQYFKSLVTAFILILPIPVAFYAFNRITFVVINYITFTT